MKVAVVGGTGLVGRYVVDALPASGHDPVVVTRSTGVDVQTGEGLAEALAGADSAVDVLNFPAETAEESERLFGTAAAHLLAAEAAAGVRHHVLLSILGLDRVGGNPHYAGKRAQEAVALDGSIPATILRAAMFHEFPGMVVDWTRRGDVATVPPLLIQPVAASDVGRVLAELAVGEPQGVIDLAGPERQDFVDMARRTLAARGEDVRVVPTWEGTFGREMAGNVLLPGPEARLEKTTFDEWLAAQAGGAK